MPYISGQTLNQPKDPSVPENPLLPNRKLQQLYSAMLRARAAASARPAGLEAILAAVSRQLEPGDIVLPFAHAAAFGELLQPGKRGVTAATVLAPSPAPLSFAAGVAAAAQLAGSQRLVVALLDAREPEPNWPELLDHIQRDRLPFIVICPDLAASTGSPLTWASLTPVIRKLRFPVLTVDGADGVAMSRAMQESVIRARHGDGPALLWCLLTDANAQGKYPKASSPVARLERYLTARRIAFPAAATTLEKLPARRRSPKG